MLALHEALDFHDWLTRARKAARLEHLRRRFVDALVDVPGVRLAGGAAPERVRVITAVSLSRVPAADLAAWLWRSQRFPHGVVLLTGTGIVPDESFTLLPGDRVTIRVDGVGTLENTVITV